MKSSIARSCLLLALLCLGIVGPASADTITFEDQSGPSKLADASPQTLNYSTSSGALSITGGTVLTKASFLAADQTSIYGTADFTSSLYGYTLSNTITLTFASPISGLSLDLIAGMPGIFTVSDNQGNTTSVNLPANYSTAPALISLAATGNVITISTSNPQWDFFVDNISFNQTTATPEPGTMLLLGFGVLALSAAKLLKK